MPRRTQRKVRYAVVGLGHIAQVAVLPAFAHARRNSELAALVSGDREKLDELGRMYDVEVRGSYDDLERCLNVCDAVYIATPNGEPISLRPFGPEPGPDRHEAMARPPVRKPRTIKTESPHE